MYQIKSNTTEKNNKAMDDKMIAFLNKSLQNQKQIRIISVWRFPGKTVPGEGLPDEIMDEIAEVV